MDNPLISFLLKRDHLSPRELGILNALVQRQETVPVGTEIVAQGSQPDHSCLLLQGFAFREHFFRKGARMISAVHVPGDFVDLHSLLLGHMDHSVTAASSCLISRVPHGELRRLSHDEPHLWRLFGVVMATDAAISRKAVTVLGRLSPQARLAHLACELYLRLEVVGLASDHKFSLPAIQVDLADMFGMSTVHLNRSLQTLRATGALEWQGQEVTILHWDRLAELAEFDTTYLNLEDKPR